jgi:hypothetical protein
MGANFAKLSNDNNLVSIYFNNLGNNISKSNISAQILTELVDFINNNGGVTIANVDINAYANKYKTIWNTLGLNNIKSLAKNENNPKILFGNISKIHDSIQSLINMPTLGYIYFFNSKNDKNNISIVIPNILFKSNGSDYFKYLITLAKKNEIGNNKNSKFPQMDQDKINQGLSYLNIFYSNLTGNIEMKVLNLLNIIIEYSVFAKLGSIQSSISLSQIGDKIPIILSMYLNNLPDNLCIFNNKILNLEPNICSELTNTSPNKTSAEDNNFMNKFGLPIIACLSILLVIFIILYIFKK